SSPVSGGVNLFANDGSFLELFKRKARAPRSASESGPEKGDRDPGPPSGPDEGAVRSPAEDPEPGFSTRVFCPFTQVGKRRGGNKLALKTGIVAKKQKTEDEVLTSKGDAWAKYMAEVKKYKAHQCGDDDKTRPLVK
ncbi:hypothetical protein PANDA_009855, partial [Ailuropoda melanoleuca]